MHKGAFQALKRTLMHVSDLPPPYFDFKKLIFYKLFFFNQNMVGEDLIHACVSGPETHVYACLKSSPTLF